MNKIIGLVFALLAAMAFVALFSYNVGSENRPTILVWEINTSPDFFSEKNPKILIPSESVICREYDLGKSHKWKDQFRYVYIIVKHNRHFKRTKYLDAHIADAVDTNVVFSNQLPSEKDFIFDSMVTIRK